ncbi:MAG: metallophosphoesterase [Lachnospiraceae bacterium]|nr:metallophosphoesterase [Lachnospiraceae bacterium]
MEWMMAGTVCLAAAAVFAGYERWENHRLITENYTFSFRNLPKAFDGSRFVFLTDLHNNQFGENNETLFVEIQRAKPEALFIGGDMIVGRRPEQNDRTKEFVKRLAAEYPIYYTYGNHEANQRYAADGGAEAMEHYEKELTAAGVRFLHNETVCLERNGERIAITGMELPPIYYKRGKVQKMEADVLESLAAKPEEFTILLAHTPFYFRNYTDWGADLVLSGHVHGGMVKLPLIGGVASPQYTLFPEYDSGVYTQENTRMLLSRGLGLHTIPIRVFNRPELSAIQLRKG